MRNQTGAFIFYFGLLLFSCTQVKQQRDHVALKPPTVVEAIKYKVPVEKLSPPSVVVVSGAKKTLAGKPEIVKFKSNVFPAKPERIVPAGMPKLIIPGKGNFESPRVVTAIDSSFAAGKPEIIVLDDDYSNLRKQSSFLTIKAVQGLISNEISSLCQDKAGNIWIGEWWGGVSRYDGHSLTNYSVAQGLNSDLVHNVFADKSGNIWIGTGSGLNKFDGKYITHYSVSEGLGDNTVHQIAEDKHGNIWFGTNNGLYRFDGKSFTHYTTAQGLPDNIVKNVQQDRKGNLWIGSLGGLTKVDGDSLRIYTTALDLDVMTSVGSIAEDNEGNLWFGAADGSSGGLYKYDGRFFSHYTTKGGLCSNRISRLATDKDGNLWIGSWDHGVSRYDGKTFTNLGTEQGLSNEVVPAVLPDRRGNIWLATTTGLCKYEGFLFSHIIPLKQDEIECIEADRDGNIWLGTGAGPCVNMYDGKSMSRYTIAQGFAHMSINQIHEDRSGNIWFCGRGGVDKFDGTYFTNYSTKDGLIDNAVYCMQEDKKGNFWFGTDKGLSKFDGKKFTNYHIAQGLNDETIVSLFEDHNGILWIGTDSKGVCTFDGVSFTHFDVANSLSHPTVVGITEDKNKNIWCCTNKGVNRYDGKYFTWYTIEQGLTNNIAKNVAEDQAGNIWVGTISGLNRFIPNPAASGNGSSFFKKYTVADGFSGGGTYEASITLDNKGNLWIGANDRLTRYHPHGEISDTIPPTIQLTNVSLFDEDISWTELEMKKKTGFTLPGGTRLHHFDFTGVRPWYNVPEKLVLRHDNNHLNFQFIGITTKRPKEIRYQYMLEGFDENWSSFSDHPLATYSKLPHGKFTFKVKAVNSEGYWSDELEYSFIIFPPWWKTWWAYLVYVAGLLFAVWAFTWYRSRRLKAENLLLEAKVIERTHELEQSLEQRYELSKKIESQQALINERLRIGRELHDDIGSTLGSISIYSEVAKNRREKNENAGDVLAKIGNTSRELIEKISDIVWSLNPNNENFEQLQNRMHSFATMMLVPRNIQYNFVTDGELNSLQLTSTQSKNIFLIYKEALYNTTKYADCEKVSILLSRQNDQLIMTIRDDGKGFDINKGAAADENGARAQYVGGNGIKNMHARASDMKAKLLIHTMINEGTTVQLIMDFSQK